MTTLETQPLTSWAGMSCRFIAVWAADGKGWYVAVGDGNRGVLYYVDLEGRVRTNLMELMTATDAVLSPNSQHVAFADWTVSANVWKSPGL